MATISEADICATLAQSPLFDAQWYLDTYPAARLSALDPVLHYVRFGEKEFYRPSAGFDPRVYQVLKGESDNVLYNFIRNPGHRSPYNGEMPIVFAVNEDYARYLGVAIASLAYNANPDYRYRLYILYNELSSDTKTRLQSQAVNNIEIELIDVSGYISEISKNAYVSGHVSKETYYRILIPRLFPHLDKCIYLDCDIIVNSDLLDLYGYDISEYYLGAVEENWQSPEFKKVEEKYSLDGRCFNAGILLMNISMFIENNLYDIFMNHVNSGEVFPTFDQDIMNFITMGKVLFLPMTWNYMWQFFCNKGYRYADRDKLREFVEYFHDHAITHYNSKMKPWLHDDGLFTPLFWKYAVASPWYEELLAACPFRIAVPATVHGR